MFNACTLSRRKHSEQRPDDTGHALPGIDHGGPEMNRTRSRWTVLTLGLVFLLLLAMAVPAAAVKPVSPDKAQKLTWHAVTFGSSDYVDMASRVPGHVNINTPNGRVTMIINGQINLTPYTTYGVWIREFTGYTGPYLTSYPLLNYYKLATFTTDAYGRGSFHFNIRERDLTDATRNIQVAVNTSAYDADFGFTVAATVKFTSIKTG